MQRTSPEVRIVRRAFEIRPEPVPTLDPHGEYLVQAWDQSIRPLAERMGMTMKFPAIQPRSRLAHEAACFARTHGAFDPFHGEVFRAFFERGENIGDIEVLVRLAEIVGLPGDELRQALEAERFRGEVLADQRLAHELGIEGVPAFAGNRRRVAYGLHPAGELAKLAKES